MQEAEIRKSLRLEPTDYYQTHLSLVNCVLPVDFRMTPKEIEVLAIFMSFEDELSIHRFGPTGRKIVMRKANISPSGLSNYIGSLIKKEILTESGDIINISPLLQVNKDMQIYKFRLLRNNNVNTTIQENVSEEKVQSNA